MRKVMLLGLLMSSLVHASTTTPNMDLIIPAVGDTDYPTSISSSFTLIDTHDHSTGKGVQVTAGGLAPNSVINGKIATSATDTTSIEVNSGILRVKDGGISKAKLSSLNIVSSANCGVVSGPDFVFSTISGSLVDVTNCTLNITASSGRAIVLSLVDRGSTTQDGQIGASTGGGSQCTLAFLRASTVISRASYAVSSSQLSVGSNYMFIDTAPSVGSNTYKVQASTQTPAGAGCIINNLKLIAYEL